MKQSYPFTPSPPPLKSLDQYEKTLYQAKLSGEVKVSHFLHCLKCFKMWILPLKQQDSFDRNWLFLAHGGLVMCNISSQTPGVNDDSHCAVFDCSLVNLSSQFQSHIDWKLGAQRQGTWTAPFLAVRHQQRIEQPLKVILPLVTHHHHSKTKIPASRYRGGEVHAKLHELVWLQSKSRHQRDLARKPWT